MSIQRYTIRADGDFIEINASDTGNLIKYTDLTERVMNLAAKWRKEIDEADSDMDNYNPPSAEHFAFELIFTILGESI